MAKDLVNIYPAFGDNRFEGNGFEIWYQAAENNIQASGYLQDRLQNQRRKLKARQPPKSLKRSHEEIDGWRSEDEGVFAFLFY